MKVLESVKLSLKLMLKNKMRTGLTVLGMLIGIASIMIVFSTGEGIRSLIIGQVESFGTNIIQTEIRVPSTKSGMDSEMDSAQAIAGGTQITSLKERDLEDLKKIQNVKNGYGAVLGQETVSYLNESKRRFVFGVSASYIDIDSTEVEFGSFFTEEEDKSLAQVVVLGAKVAEDIFKGGESLNKSINLGKSKY
ncbi:MAG: ABC transporter permease, partial [Patescibacteria group bacterium]